MLAILNLSLGIVNLVIFLNNNRYWWCGVAAGFCFMYVIHRLCTMP